jgi:uncharacterized protein (DUF736 family)
MPAIGYVTKQSDGSYKGELKTLSIRTALEIRPNPNKQNDKQPDYRVVANQNIEIGAAWIKVGQESNPEYVQLSLAAPEFGRRKLFANLGKAAGQDDADVFAIIWNPEE